MSPKFYGIISDMNRLTENQKSQIYRLYWEENLGTPDIAKMFGVSVPAIRIWMKKLGIPIRSFSEAQKLYNNTAELTDDLLREMYDSGMSQEKIAKQFNITQSAIRFRMEKAGIQSRSKANNGSKNGMYGRKHSPEAIQKMRESNR